MSRETPPAEPPVEVAPAAPAAPVATPEAVGSSAPARPDSRTEDRPAPRPAAPTEPPETADIADDVRDRVFSRMSDDDLKNHPALRDRYNKFVSSEKKKLEDAAAAREQETQRYVAMSAEFDRLEAQARAGNPHEFLAQLENPMVAANYARIKEWRQNRSVQNDDSLARAANSMVDGLVTSLKEDEDWAELSDGEWNEIFSERDVKKVLARLVAAGTAKERRSLQAKAKAEIEAGINEALAKRGLSMTSPESPHGAVVGDGSGGLTLEQYSAMSPSERRVLRRDNPQAIDAMTSGLLESQLAPNGT